MLSVVNLHKISMMSILLVQDASTLRSGGYCGQVASREASSRAVTAVSLAFSIRVEQNVSCALV